MTDPVTLGTAVVALGVAIAAGYLHLPRVPDLDGERWFKVMLATLIRGEVEREGGDVEAWEERVIRFVPYHPLGRRPERKLRGLGVAATEGLPGERALADAIAALPAGRARWERLYDTDPEGVEARLVDPYDLGPAYDPATVLGPGWHWDALAAWGDFRGALLRRFTARFALVGEGALLDALAIELGDRAARVEPSIEALRGTVPEPSDRLVIVATGEAPLALLRVLSGEPSLRDRVLALVSVGGVLRGRPGVEGPLGEAVVGDWMAHHFGHDALDTEMSRPTFYVALQWADRDVDPPGAPGLPIESQRFPDPAGEPGPSRIETVDLGPLPIDPELPVQAVARALIAWTACWILARS